MRLHKYRVSSRKTVVTAAISLKSKNKKNLCFFLFPSPHSCSDILEFLQGMHCPFSHQESHTWSLLKHAKTFRPQFHTVSSPSASFHQCLSGGVCDWVMIHGRVSTSPPEPAAVIYSARTESSGSWHGSTSS